MHPLPDSSQISEHPEPGSDGSGVARANQGRMKSSRLVVLVGLALLSLLATWVIRPSAAISGWSPAVGLQAPDLFLVSVCDGEHQGSLDVRPVARELSKSSKVRLSKVAFNECRVSIVHFWGTWCGPCRDELPELGGMCEELRNNPEFEFFSVSCSSFDDPSLSTLHSRTCQFYQSHDLELPTYADPTQRARAEFLRLMQRQTMAYPTTILIDRDGVIRATWVGVPPGGAETIRKKVLRLLDET